MILSINTQLLAEVYYCVDKDSSGFKSVGGNYTYAQYIPEKFKAKIDFDEGTFDSKDIGMNYMVDCVKRGSEKFSMTCSSPYGEIFTIDGSNTSIDIFNYVRAETYGRGDSILVAHGNCEKF